MWTAETSFQTSRGPVHFGQHGLTVVTSLRGEHATQISVSQLGIPTPVLTRDHQDGGYGQKRAFDTLSACFGVSGRHYCRNTG